MRLLHTADWHLGQVLHGFDRTAEHELFLDWLHETIIEEQIDALIVAGDVFDVANPSIRSTKLLYRWVARLRRAAPALDIVLIGGNHDSPSRLELPLSLLDAAIDGEHGEQRRPIGSLTIVGALARRDGEIDVDAIVAPLTDASRAIGAVCAAVPFPRAGDLPGGADADGESGLAALYAAALAAARRRAPGAPIILTGHLAIAGAELSGPSERRVSIGGAETASSAIFPADADYVALGHLHRPQTTPGPTMIRYAGAPFPLSATERDYRHSVTIATFEDGAVTLQERVAPRPVAFLRTPARGAAPLADVEAALAALAPPAAPPGLEPFLEVAVALDGPTPDLRARIEAAIGEAPVRLVRIVCDRVGAAESAGLGGLDAPIGSIDAETIFDNLHRDRFGEAPSAALAAAFAKLKSAVEIGPTDDPADAEARDDAPPRADKNAAA